MIGLGSAGSMALWRLSLMADVEAIGFEQFGIGHPHGSFSGESRLFRTAYQEGAKYVPLLSRARELWGELESASGRRLFHRYGVLTVSRATNGPFVRLLDSIEEHGLPHELLDAAELRERYPQLDVADDEVGVLDPLGGALRPESGVLSAVKQARANGAEVRDHDPVISIADAGDGVDIVSESGTTRVDRVIVTAGSWSKLLIPELEPLVEVGRITLTWFVPEAAVEPLYQPEALPCFIRDRDSFHVFGAPIVDGYSAKISSDAHPPIGADRPELMDLRRDPAELSEFGREVRKIFPGVSPEPVHYSVHHDGFTPDKTPIIDRRGSTVVVAGLSGHGYKLAPAYGELAAQLATDLPAETYHPDFAIAAHRPF